MIYTVTMNPAIDLFCQTRELVPKRVNRTTKDDIQPNGKGVNISFILRQLGIDSVAYGFSAGFTGAFIQEALTEKKIREDFVRVDGMTRINVFINVENQQTEYKVVNPGPVVELDAQAELLAKIEQIDRGDTLCVSGSLPQGCSPTILVDIAAICHRRGIRLVMDTSYREVLACLAYQPYLLKPNEEELSEWFGETLADEAELIEYAQKLVSEGCQQVLLSLGSEGAVLIDGEVILRGNAPNGQVVNTACAGDTLLGTFLGCRMQGCSKEESLKQAIAAGSSTAFREGLTDFSDTDALAQQITIKRMEENK
ncbi:1-phosphofructokinase [Vagococcus acidifermentans]|uniref:Tagatose-6-phosphate kinase n=1 Tax=Vagococcus acidifermentans TaxID=564710 RepID=A0A430B2X7_9ENTE|nr:1-phosphofructokinase [Vagococcus acidifermentans]RSU14659.1 1-phosphofructokinase [Vagococcus acidifermentans]